MYVTQAVDIDFVWCWMKLPFIQINLTKMPLKRYRCDKSCALSIVNNPQHSENDSDSGNNVITRIEHIHQSNKLAISETDFLNQIETGMVTSLSFTFAILSSGGNTARCTVNHTIVWRIVKIFPCLVNLVMVSTVSTNSSMCLSPRLLF